MNKQKILAIIIVLIALVTGASFIYKDWKKAQENKAPSKALFSAKFGDAFKPKIIVYSDFLCNKCHDYNNNVIKNLKKDYVDTHKARLEIRPLTIIDENSIPLTELAMCANEQNKFLPAWDYISDQINRDNDKSLKYNANHFFDDYKIKDVSNKIGTKYDQLNNCYKERKYDDKVRDNDQIAYDHNINSVPILFMSKLEQPIRGAVNYGFIKSSLDRVIK